MTSCAQTVAYQVIINSPVLLHAPTATMCLLNPISLSLMANKFQHAKKKTDPYTLNCLYQELSCTRNFLVHVHINLIFISDCNLTCVMLIVLNLC